MRTTPTRGTTTTATAARREPVLQTPEKTAAARRPARAVVVAPSPRAAAAAAAARRAPPVVAAYAAPAPPPPRSRPAAGAARPRRSTPATRALREFASVHGPSVDIAEARGHVELRSREELIAASDARPPEVSIAAQFYNTKTGATTTSTKATKTQRRKHQINSLAISAAERELEPLDKKGKSNKTKHETNARCGW
ncbi:hypothetical protein JL721_11169 [Aureococcus anophagefferens]|nr:hypothetical protein JL721_11169 [Aureococcus anophagefferens]